MLPYTQSDLEKKIDEGLKEYATKNSEYTSEKNRKLNENFQENKEETYRTRFRRDRDRILYSSAFRRMQFKTQVVCSLVADDFRTRLTHTLEVEQIAMSIADALGLNKDLVSAIALGHDIGHTPFGHAVERLIDTKLCPFSHSIQSFRYAVLLAYEFDGLRLADQILDGILKHDTDIYTKEYEKYKDQIDYGSFNSMSPPSLEGQVVYWADKIAYLSHDYEDFKNSEIKYDAVKSGNITNQQLEELERSMVPDEIEKIRLRDIIRSIISNLVEGSLQNLEKVKPTSSLDAIRKTENLMNKNMTFELATQKKSILLDSLIINFTDEYRSKYKMFRNFLDEHYLKSPQVQKMDAKAERITSDLILAFTNNTKLLPWNVQQLLSKGEELPSKSIPRVFSNCSKERVIADYIAGMTDRFAEALYRDLFMIGVN